MTPRPIRGGNILERRARAGNRHCGNVAFQFTVIHLELKTVAASPVGVGGISQIWRGTAEGAIKRHGGDNISERDVVHIVPHQRDANRSPRRARYRLVISHWRVIIIANGDGYCCLGAVRFTVINPELKTVCAHPIRFGRVRQVGCIAAENTMQGFHRHLVL